jgi:tetratricopeptide (TPR) repeat protein/tRNA A-37 threonylcarbamoyl transferase component Bud32
MNEDDERTRTVPPKQHPTTITSPPRTETEAVGGFEATLVQPSTPTFVFQAPGLPTVPGYTVLREVARGGMGVVYEAHDGVFDRRVAVKVMHAGQDAERFVVESKVTAQLTHPGIPPVHALGTLPDGRTFLAMKLIEGRTLTAVLMGTSREDLPRLLSDFEYICQTVGFAHSKGIVHRDLKPSNVMVGQFGEVLVMDWGLAKHAGSEQGVADSEKSLDATHSPASAIEQTQAGQVKGTPAYMAPEQARGESVDARADVFALGGILAVMLTGKPPFAGETVMDTVLKAGQADLADCFAKLDTCGVDPELVAVAKRCLASKATERFNDGKAVADAIAAHRAGVEERLRRSERERAVSEAETREQRKRRRVQLALAGAIGLLLLTGIGFAWWHDRQDAIEKRKALEVEAEKDRREQAELLRLTRNRDAMTNLLDQTESALRAGNADRAGEMMAQASTRFDEGGCDELQPRVDQCRRELDMLRKLDAVATTRWTLGNLLRLPTWKELSPQLAQAFAEYGITPKVTPEDAARLISGSHIREALLAYLEIWAVASDREPALLAILHAADPDEFRDSVRVQGYPRVAMAMAFRGEPILPKSPPVWFAIGQGQDIKLPMSVREYILLAAHRERPNDIALLLTLSTLGDVTDKESANRRVGWCRAALAVQPRSITIWNNLGVALRELGDLSGAAKAYEKAIEIAPASAPAYNNLGNLYRASRRREEAVKLFDQAIALNPKYAFAYSNRGAVLGELNRWPDAAASHREAIKIDPNYSRAHYNLGIALSAMGDKKGAIAAYEEAIRLEPKFASAYNNLGVARRAIGDLAGAKEAYLKAMEYGDGGPGVRTNMSGIYFDEKNYAEAIKWAKEAIQVDPKYANAHMVLGSAYFFKGEVVEARRSLTEAARLDSKWKHLLDLLPPVPVAPPPHEVKDR